MTSLILTIKTTCYAIAAAGLNEHRPHSLRLQQGLAMLCAATHSALTLYVMDYEPG